MQALSVVDVFRLENRKPMSERVLLDRRAGQVEMPALFAVGLIVFISAVRDIPTVVFLASSRSETISLLMLDYLAGAEFEKSTVIGVFIVLVIIVAALIGRALGVRLAPRH